MWTRALILVVVCASVRAHAYLPASDVQQRSAGNKGCPPGFIGHDSTCYFFSHTDATFGEAHALCDYLSSRLARITTLDEKNFIRGHLQRYGKGKLFYVDGTDMRVEGTWAWDKPYKQMTYFDWYPGEPNRGSGENCIVLHPTLYAQYDIACSYRGRFVCETKKQ